MAAPALAVKVVAWREPWGVSSPPAAVTAPGKGLLPLRVAVPGPVLVVAGEAPRRPSCTAPANVELEAELMVIVALVGLAFCTVPAGPESAPMVMLMPLALKLAEAEVRESELGATGLKALALPATRVPALTVMPAV